MIIGLDDLCIERNQALLLLGQCLLDFIQALFSQCMLFTRITLKHLMYLVDGDSCSTHFFQMAGKLLKLLGELFQIS
ncbi:hypothetical protein EAH72_29375 [Pseudomonas caspiana]|nr:hypothetical protein EAH72_29375 [Pseudomonas caspiana]